MIETLEENGYKTISVYGFDTNESAVLSSYATIKRKHPNVHVDLRVGDYLESAQGSHKSKHRPGNSVSSLPTMFDIVIANPPYVRTQILGAKRANELAHAYGLSGRVDLYQVFLLAMLKSLKPGGVAGVIVSNRFLTTMSGSALRKTLINEYKINHIWDFGDTKLFKAAVLPAVLLVQPKDDNQNESSHNPLFSAVYESDLIPTAETENVFSALQKGGVVTTNDNKILSVRHGVLNSDRDSSGIWRLENQSTQRWLKTVDEHTWGHFEDIGKIKVGVKTTADHVFIRSDWNELPAERRPELLFPLTTHHCARRYRGKETKPIKEILYPYQTHSGKRVTVDLSEFPNTAAYLEENKEILARRHYIIESGRKWFEIWVPHDPALWARPKIVFRDISSDPTFWLDLSGSIINGDCYWISCENEKHEDLLWFATGVANSEFIKKFYDIKFNNRLYSGRRRFMTQYVRKFPLPDPDGVYGKRIIETSKKIYALIPSKKANQLEIEMNSLVEQAFGLLGKEAIW